MKRSLPWFVISAVAVGSSCDPGTDLDWPVIPIGPLSLTVVSAAEDPLWEVRDVLAHGGTFWALTASAPYVHRVAPTGELTTRLGTSGDGPGEFRFPSAVWPGKTPGSLTVWDRVPSRPSPSPDTGPCSLRCAHPFQGPFGPISPASPSAIRSGP